MYEGEKRVRDWIRPVVPLIAIFICLLLVGCEGQIEVELSLPDGSEVEELLDAVVRSDYARIEAALAPAVRYAEEGRGRTGRTREATREEFARRLPRLYGEGSVVSASFARQDLRVQNRRMTVTGDLRWTVVEPRNYDAYTVTGRLTVGLTRYGDEWLISEWRLLRTDERGKKR